MIRVRSWMCWCLINWTQRAIIAKLLHVLIYHTLLFYLEIFKCKKKTENIYLMLYKEFLEVKNNFAVHFERCKPLVHLSEWFFSLDIFCLNWLRCLNDCHCLELLRNVLESVKYVCMLVYVSMLNLRFHRWRCLCVEFPMR